MMRNDGWRNAWWLFAIERPWQAGFLVTTWAWCGIPAQGAANDA